MTAGAPPSATGESKPRLRRRLAASQHPVAQQLRRWNRASRNIRLPLPLPIVRVLWKLYLVVQTIFYRVYRFLICEPLFRAACTSVGKRMRTGFFMHWVQGSGRIILGDDVTIDGKCSFMFADRFSDSPTFRVGDRTMIGHGCGFVIARQVTIGQDCLLAMGVNVFDSSGHPVDPGRRLAGLPLEDAEVKPVTIGNNVWIGASATIFPGVTIGDGAVIAARAVVVNNVAPNTLVAGYPARKIQELTPATRESATGQAPGGIVPVPSA
jgi:carbonic anhydrase/acetyltransferase-like protein (isoleucine patch superfamily)